MQKLFDSEIKVMELIWEKEPVSAKELSVIAEEKFTGHYVLFALSVKSQGIEFVHFTGFIGSGLIANADLGFQELPFVTDFIATAFLSEFVGAVHYI